MAKIFKKKKALNIVIEKNQQKKLIASLQLKSKNQIFF